MTRQSSDAVRLKRALVAAHRGERDVVDALHEYEIGMRDYGFRAVRNLLKAMRQTVTDSTLALIFSRTMLRAINACRPSSGGWRGGWERNDRGHLAVEA